MKIYIRFENGEQVEATTLESKPTGGCWKKAPLDFDFSKKYRLSAGGNVEEVPAEEVALMRLESAKTLALQELSRLVEAARVRYTGGFLAKQKCYELQEKAANAVILDSESELGAIIQPLAEIRNIGILWMAQLIIEKAYLSNQKIIQAEAIEDNYQKLIEGATSMEQIDQILQEVITTLEGF
jgi:hypothetical protein